MMKIAQVCPRYSPYIGGVETHVREISERLVKKHLDVEVLTTKDKKASLPRKEVANGVAIRRFDLLLGNVPWHLSRDLHRHLLHHSREYDIVHAHDYHDFPALYAASAKRCNLFVFSPHYHGGGSTLLTSLLHVPYKYLGRSLFDKADIVVSVSNYEKELVKRNFGVDDHKIVLVGNGVDLKELRSLSKRVESGRRTVLYVGRLEKYKGVEYLIRMLPLLAGDICVDIVGSGPERESLAGLANRLGVSRRVNFFQELSRSELLEEYARADLFVLLSRHEAYSITVAEALAAGIPCIVANTSALVEWVDDKDCFGINYPIDLDTLANLVTRTIGGSVRYQELMSWDEVVEQLTEVYDSMMDSRKVSLP